MKHPPPPPDYPLAARPVGFEVPGAGPLYLWSPRGGSEALLDEPRYAAEFEAMNELMPYWADLWPASRALALHLAATPALRAGRRDVLEVGAGLGAAGLTLARLGHRVTLTDVAPTALELLRIHARVNGLRVTVAPLDLLDPAAAAPRCALLVGSDVLFEQRNVPGMLSLLRRSVRPGGLGLLADPMRPPGDALAEALDAEGWRWHTVELSARAPTRLFIIEAWAPRAPAPGDAGP